MAFLTDALNFVQDALSGHSTSNDLDLAIISVSDKTDVVKVARGLAEQGRLQLVATGGTAAILSAAGLNVVEVSSLTGAPEMLGGRVKSLHPVVHAGILARNTRQDLDDLVAQNIRRVRVVVCNLYPFEQVVASKSKHVDWAEKVENIDIGGVTLLRAAAKNHERVTVMCDPADYESVLREFASSKHDTTPETRRRLAAKAFSLTAAYDACVSNQMMLEFNPDGLDVKLRYGINPQNQPAFVTAIGGREIPFKVLNGAPSYVNILDALNAWQLVRELRVAFDPPQPAAASFKHCSPAGAAVGVPLTPDEVRAYFVEDLHERLSPLACAYARARGADRLSSFGDFIALSDECDAITAQIISREVSDGIIAPGFTPEALEILRSKKGGSYLMLQMDGKYEPSTDRLESRDVFGMQLKQAPSTIQINFKVFQEATIVGGGKQLDRTTLRDMLVATAAVKYTQSNSVIFACNGQVVGVGAGQQSRIHCVRLAGEKVRNWWLRQHPKTLALQFAGAVKRAEKSNLVDAFVRGEIGREMPREQWDESVTGNFGADFNGLTEEETESWMKKLSGVVLSSDAFFPFRDCVDYAATNLNVKCIASPGGSSNDASSIEAAQEHGVTLVHTGLRLFHH